MFLTVGEKIKQCRLKYNLRQAQFSNYGISQYYLSMIETNKRTPSYEVVESIYRAFEELTNKTIYTEYVFEEFVKSDKVQASEWCYNQLGTTDFPSQFLLIEEVAHKYDLKDVLFHLYKKLGEFYHQNGDDKTSNDFLQKALILSSKVGYKSNEIYRLLGENLANVMNYEGALSYYVSALRELDKKNDEKYYSMLYHVGLTECRLGNYNKAILCADEVMDQATDQMVKVAGILLKEKSFRHLGSLEEGRELLLKSIESEISQDYLIFIYHNLALNFQRSQKYDDALEYAFKGLNLVSKYSKEKEKTMVLIGQIYLDLKLYDEAIHFIDSIKKSICHERDERFIKWMYTVYHNIYSQTNKIEEIIHLINELEQLYQTNQISIHVLNELKTEFIKTILKNKNYSLYEQLNGSLKPS